MAYPDSGFIKIYPESLLTNIVGSGEYALNSDVGPQPSRPIADIRAYFATRVTNLAIAPCIRRNFEVPPASGVYVPAAATNFELTFSPSTSAIEFFDNSYPSAIVATVDMFSALFPRGMTINQLRVWYTGETLIGPNRDRSIDSMVFKYAASVVETFTPVAGLVTSHATPSNSIVSSIFQWSPTRVLLPFGISTLVNNPASANLGTPRSVISEFFLLGVYNTQNFSFTLSTPQAIPGEIVDITNADNNFNVFTDYKIYWDTGEEEEDVDPLNPGITGGVVIPSRYFFIRTNGRIKFQIPENLGIPYGGRRLILAGVGDGVTFFGEFTIAQLNILLVDGSGVYQLTEDQRHDTYYNRATTPITEINLKFPRPGFRTGFF